MFRNPSNKQKYGAVARQRNPKILRNCINLMSNHAGTIGQWRNGKPFIRKYWEKTCLAIKTKSSESNLIQHRQEIEMDQKGDFRQKWIVKDGTISLIQEYIKNILRLPNIQTVCPKIEGPEYI